MTRFMKCWRMRWLLQKNRCSKVSRKSGANKGMSTHRNIALASHTLKQVKQLPATKNGCKSQRSGTFWKRRDFVGPSPNEFGNNFSFVGSSKYWRGQFWINGWTCISLDDARVVFRWDGDFIPAPLRTEIDGWQRATQMPSFPTSGQSLSRVESGDLCQGPARRACAIPGDILFQPTDIDSTLVEDPASHKGSPWR